MMRELADNIMDIAQNSVAAGAKLLELSVIIDENGDTVSLIFDDDGKGMSADFVKTVADPFTTSRTTRKVGLGLPFLKMTALMTGGDFAIESELGRGTKVTAVFGLSSIDRPPMGDVAGTFYALAVFNTQMDFLFVYSINGESFEFDTRQIREAVEPLPLDSPEISDWIRDYLSQEIKALHGGAIFQ